MAEANTHRNTSHDQDKSCDTDTSCDSQKPLYEHDKLLIEIENNEAENLDFVIRAVYESSESDRFMKRLADRIKGHDKEIERMCNFHYQGFIDSIRELLQVSKDANVLRKEIDTTNQSLKDSCDPLFVKGDELTKTRMVQRNIASGIDSLSLCLPVLEMYGKLKEQMKNRRYYPALKTLEQLEHTYLPRVSGHWFSQTMTENIPVLRSSIKDASMSDLKDFLENIRKHSEKIGEVAMKHAAEQNNLDTNLARKRKKRKAPAPPNPFTGEVEGLNPFEGLQVEDEEELSAQDLIDFSPVYRCLHIYSVMGAKDHFEDYYRKQRKKQASLSLQPPPNMHETLDGYQKYFHDIIGFFVVEDHILHTTSGLVNRSNMDELWEMAVSKIAAVLRANTALCNDADTMLQIKNLIVLFCHTLKGYGFSVAQLYDLLLDVRDMYNEILMKRWVAKFDEIFNQDNYTAIMVEDLQHYRDITNNFPFTDDGTQALIQISINMKYLEDSCAHLEHFISTITGCGRGKCGKLKAEDSAEKDSVHVAKLHGTSMFKDAKSRAEEQIYLKLNLKIDDFLSLASYDWLMLEPRTQPSDYISDLMAFLSSTFMSFPNLPEKVAKTACMSSCQHIANALLNLLLDNDVRQVSIGFLQQLNLDVKKCEEFATSAPVPGSSDGTLESAFTELRQLMDLVLNSDWSVYLADYGQSYHKYVRITPTTAITLLEKLHNADKKKNNIFASLKRNERDKKKHLDTVLRQLRGLQTVNGSGH